MKRNFIYFIVFLIPVYFIGFGIDIMDIDASQYAEMSREMSISNSYLQVFEIGKNYLDKPPFLFWITSISMKIFGANNFSYRLPSFLFALFALYSTYKFALLFYKKEIASLSALILASCQAFYLINHDVKTDTVLMGWVIFSIWQLAAWLQNKNLKHIIFAFAAIGFGMVTKGPIALIVPILAFGTHILLSRNFKSILRWEYLLGLLIVAVVLLPMCYGLYTQFDLHPEKLVNNKTGVSGLRFFFWTQSFGRITGESVWNNNSNIFFLFQNLLWAFLPWIVIFSVALFLEFKTIVKQKFKIEPNAEWICMGGFTFTYLALGSSKYQLPHYIFVVLPFAAIITAKLLIRLYEGEKPRLLKILEKSHFIIFSLLFLALIILMTFSFPAPIWLSIILFISIIIFYYFFTKKNISYYLIKLSVFSFLLINLFLNSWIYPSLLKYQGGNNMGRFIRTNNIPAKNTFIYEEHVWHSLHFYSNNIIVNKYDLNTVLPGDYLIVTGEKINDFAKAGLSYEVVYKVQTYGVSRLQLKFLNPSRRKELTEEIILIKII